MGSITEMATSAPGQTSIRPLNCAPLAQTLKLNGYNTAQFGKCHEVPTWQNSQVGPFDGWPTQSGFEHFFGFVAAETNQYYPTLTEGTTPIEPSKSPEEGYHFTEDMTDRAIAWIKQQKALAPHKPFFVYWAPGATHAPHQVSEEWTNKYRGKFSMGWDELRKQTLARQKEMGIVPEDAQLTGRHEGIPAWHEMDDQLKPVLERQMEVYAGFLEHTDHELGRVVDALEDLDVLGNTLIYYIIGDNGASAEGTLKGTLNEYTVINGFNDIETNEFLIENIDRFGTPKAYNHYAVGWAHAMDTPYQWTKQVASHWGGTRNGLVVHWPGGIGSKGEIRPQFSHVIDVAATVLEAAGIPEPDFVNGIQQKPYEGASMVPSFDDAAAPDVRSTQYFEMVGNRGIYHNGWTAVTQHRVPWQAGVQEMPPFDDDVWELYAPDDWSQSNDISNENPEMLHHLQRLWLIEATKYNVLPIDDRMLERVNPDIAGRPQLIKGNRQVLFGGMGRLSEYSVLTLKNKSYAITAEIEVTDDSTSGVIVTQGGITGGWSLYLKDGVPTFCHNLLGVEFTYVRGESALNTGKHQVRVEFDYDGGGAAQGGEFTLFVEGERVAAERVERTTPFIYSADETLDIGSDDASAVSEEYTPQSSKFTGTVNWVELAIDESAEDEDHYLDTEERFRVAMAIQ
jgi:arylsulfatase